MQNAIDRRSLLKGIAATGVVAATGTAVAAADEPAAWDGEADILIAGAGCAGLIAGVEALENGASVLVLEKMDHEHSGGDTLCYGGIFLAYTPKQLMGFAMGRMDEQSATAIYDESVAVMDWFHTDTDLEFLDGGAIAKGSGRAVYKALRDHAEEIGVEVLYETPLTKIITDPETGEALGIVSGEGDGARRFKANKAVIVCTGGYEANPEMVEALNYPGLETTSCGHPSVTGEGIMACQQAGGALDFMGTSVDWMEFAFAVPSRQYGTGITNRQWTTSSLFDGVNVENAPSKVFVNMAGERFMDESKMLTHDKTLTLPFLTINGALGLGADRYVNLPMFMVCDDECVKGGPLGKVPADSSWMYNSVFGIYEWSDDNQAEIEAGWILKADTIEELAEMMTAHNHSTGEDQVVDAKQLAATIDAYNAACESGVDEFGRPAEFLKPIITPPFYAAEMMPCVVYTIGGVKSDGNSRVVDYAGNPVPRLYCAGNVGQGVATSAIGATSCMARGRIAARHAVTLDPVA